MYFYRWGLFLQCISTDRSALKFPYKYFKLTIDSVKIHNIFLLNRSTIITLLKKAVKQFLFRFSQYSRQICQKFGAFCIKQLAAIVQAAAGSALLRYRCWRHFPYASCSPSATNLLSAITQAVGIFQHTANKHIAFYIFVRYDKRRKIYARGY